LADIYNFSDTGFRIKTIVIYSIL